LIISNPKFELSAVEPQQYPAGALPETAFVGRSNVGKSSFINAMLNRKGIARISSTPGKTRVINFYNIDNKLYFVDLPGYGYANVSKSQKSSWGDIIQTYLNSRPQLKLVMMLVDIRHKPSDDDRIMYEWILGHALPHIVVATKADKIPRSQVKGRLEEIKTVLRMGEGVPLVPFSSETKQGKDEIWSHMESIIFNT
jgi:GTP-binding protein